MKDILIGLLALGSMTTFAQENRICKPISDLGIFCVNAEELTNATVKLKFVQGTYGGMLNLDSNGMQGLSFLYKNGINIRGNARLNKICQIYGYDKHVRGSAIASEIEWDTGAVDILKKSHDSDMDVSGFLGYAYDFTGVTCNK